MIRSLLRHALPSIALSSSRELIPYTIRGTMAAVGFAVTADLLIHVALDAGDVLRSCVFAGLVSGLVSPFFFMSYGFALIDLCRTRQDLEHAVRTDVQTGLLNRRAFVQRFDDHEAKPWASLLIIDIDHFKRINDRYGHPAGDAAIAAVAAIIVRTLPRSALVARIGGEEYAAALDGLDGPAAFERASDLCRRVRDKGVVIEDIGRIDVTVSIGLRNVDAGMPFDAAYRDADAALYVAKATGRDRVAAAWDTAEPGDDAVRHAA